MNFWERGQCDNDTMSRESGQKTRIDKQISRYSSMSEEQLYAALLSQANGLKREGKLNIDEIEDFCGKAALFMNAEQLAKLRNLVNTLKR